MASAVLPIMPLLFQIPPGMQFILSLIFFFSDICAHMNVRFPMGRMITLVNSPQWHRIHHSGMPEHRDKNFCYLLPLWDILFGTYCHPERGEFPPTGVRNESEISSVWEAQYFPLREWLKFARGETPPRQKPAPGGSANPGAAEAVRR